jgi:hypothetical protein
MKIMNKYQKMKYGSIGRINVKEMYALAKATTIDEVYDILQKCNERICENER